MKFRLIPDRTEYLNDVSEVPRAFAPFLEISDDGENYLGWTTSFDGRTFTCVIDSDLFGREENSFEPQEKEGLIYKKYTKRFVKNFLYDYLSRHTGKELPYGSLTGVRPTGLYYELINEKDPNKGIAPATKMLEDAGLPVNDENIFIAATCKEKGILFLQGKGQIGVRKNADVKKETCDAGEKPEGYTVSVNNKKFSVRIEGQKAVVNGKSYDITVKEGVEAKQGVAPSEGTPIKAALPGAVLKINVSEGDYIDEGDVLLVLEAMKMETEIKSPKSGTVKSVEVSVGDQVKNSQTLVVIG